MSIPNEPSAGDLQFDQAEFAESAPDHPACAGCKSPIADHYYEAAGQLICPACRERFGDAFHGGSRLKRGFKALGLGLIAAAIGAAAYYAIMHATGLNIGLVAIVLGILIGGAVKMGSEGRGGWAYQLLALFLTYTAISAMHIPDIIIGFQELLDQVAVEAGDAANQDAAPQALAGEIEAPAEGDQTEPNLDETPVASAEAEEDPGHPSEIAALKAETDLESNDAELAEIQALLDEQPPTAVDLFLAVGALWVFAYVLPMYIAINSPISGLIYAFALWESWKINKKTQLVFNGPYSMRLQDSVEPEGAVDGV